LSGAGLFGDGETSVSNFQIPDPRLSNALLEGRLIVRIPSNAELKKGDAYGIYTTMRFPAWSLCVQQHPRRRAGVLYRKVQYDNKACPECPPLANDKVAWKQAQKQAIRFVRACPDGHLDDVDWKGAIRHNKEQCVPPFLLWEGGGGSLKQIDIVCPICRGETNLGSIYARDWPCSGRYPELGKDGSVCDKDARVMQRGAANLRIADIQTALTIPPKDSPLHNILALDRVQAVLGVVKPRNKQALVGMVELMLASGAISAGHVNTIKAASNEDVLTALREANRGDEPASGVELRLQEFAALQAAAAAGHPPVRSNTPGMPPLFEVIKEQVRTVVARPDGLKLRVTPVSRLRVVMVQTGYHRIQPTNKLVPTYLKAQEREWHPGVELFGEGIFIDLEPSTDPGLKTRHPHLYDRPAAEWLKAWRNPDAYGQNIPEYEDTYQLHPVFVWWHTFAHRLINALAIDSGYSSAAVRERVFIQPDEEDREIANGGVLLYTVQPGGDGTLGGLIALVPEFERVLNIAMRNLDACSNDPLCGEEEFGPDKYNGAACYACTLVSETSCEHRNMRLDRNLLLDNMP